MNEENRDPLPLLSALAVILFSLALHGWLSAPPDPQPDDFSGFSAHRAYSLLAHLLDEDAPHPIGSAQNRVVRDRITAWLTEHQLAYEIQSTVGCAKKYSSCGYVENIIVTVPGKATGKASYVALMAHYDSVPKAPGAGDDGAGVVAILETARMLSSTGPHDNHLMVIITDGEEMGLLGAEAFFDFHPLAGEIGALLNVEGSGSTGDSIVLRTSGENGLLMDTYAQTAEFPAGASLANEVFKRMPNDTDFSVSMRAGIAGIDFAFAGERNHYHTPNDNLQNLDLRTLQHHGENILPLTRKLLNTSLDTTGSGNRVYISLMGQWMQWSNLWSVVLYSLCLVCLAFVTVRWWNSSYIGILSFAQPFVILLVTCLSGWAAFSLLGRINGTTVDWPAHLWPHRTLLLGVTALGAMLTVRPFISRITLPDSVLGTWWIWALLTGGMIMTIPDAANVFLIPLVGACLFILIVATTTSNNTLVLVGTLILVTPGTLDLALRLEESQGYRLLPAFLAYVALLMVAVAPFLRGRFLNQATLIAGLITLLGFGTASYLPLYSEWRPQHLNIQYWQNEDNNTAHWRLLSPNPLPRTLTSQGQFGSDSILPWSDYPQFNVASADHAGLLPPTYELIASEWNGEQRELTLGLRTHREANFLQLILAPDTKVMHFELEGNRITPSMINGGPAITIHGIQNKDVILKLHTSGTDSLVGWLLDCDFELPANDLTEARGALATPAHRGECAYVHRSVSL